MFALLLPLSHPETVAGRRKWLWKPQLLYRPATIFQVWEPLQAPSLISLLNQNFSSHLKPMKEAVASETKVILLKNNTRELYMQSEKKPTARYSRNTRPNLPLPSRNLKSLAKSCENPYFIWLTVTQFFLLFTDCTLQMVWKYFLWMNVTILISCL